MSEFFEIAFAAASKRLCLFTGTGFSKAISDNQIPGWQELLEKICDDHEIKPAIRESLFPKEKENPLNLEEAAQVLAMELASADKDIHKEIAEIVSNVNLAGEHDHISEFFEKRSFRIITTNYDKLAEELVGTESDCQSLCPGLPVPRSNSRVKVFHVHGSVDVTAQMVVTSDDYFRFMDRDSYFSRKLSTILHENTVVILGYSLGDTHLKAILNEYRGFVRDHNVGSSIFFVSRSPVDQTIADYYANCYGIRVIDETDINDLFQKISSRYAEAEKDFDKILTSTENVLNKGRSFKEKFLKLDTSFYMIVSALGAKGVSLESPEAVKMFGEIIEKKRELTTERDAWEQYEHLASWLAHLGALIEIKGRSIEQKYLSAVQYSMEKMSKKKLLGYSWHAYRQWEAKWKNMQASNRALIKYHIEENSTDPDALTIVNLR